MMFSNQHQIADVNDGREKKTENERDLSDVNRVDEHHHAPENTQIPKLDGNDAALEALRHVPLNDKAAREKQIGHQSEKRPEGELAGEITPKIVQIMRQELFIAF